jgi:solute carrier family 35 protein E1
MLNDLGISTLLSLISMNLTNATVHEQSPPSSYVSPSSPAVISPSSNDLERFPSLDEIRANGHIHQVASPVEITPTHAAPDRYKWLPRKSTQTERDSGRIPRLATHQPKRSVSDAFRNIRARRGSVTENAQELAEALKAPISYTLVVRFDVATPSTTAI